MISISDSKDPIVRVNGVGTSTGLPISCFFLCISWKLLRTEVSLSLEWAVKEWPLWRSCWQWGGEPVRCPGFPKESMGWVACMWAAFSCLGAVSSQGLVLAKYAGPISVPCDPPHYLLVGGQGGSLESSEKTWWLCLLPWGINWEPVSERQTHLKTWKASQRWGC